MPLTPAPVIGSHLIFIYFEYSLNLLSTVQFGLSVFGEENYICSSMTNGNMRRDLVLSHGYFLSVVISNYE